MQEQTIKIAGMSCQGCVRSVERVLTGLAGVERVVVSLEQGQVQVSFDPRQVSDTQLRAAIVSAGFEAP
jgi:copper chaperone